MYTMADLRGQYYRPMDKSYHVPITEKPLIKGLDEPILPINQLGETVPENDPQGRNIIQTTQAAIRGGAGTLQIVMTTSHQAAIGGRFKAMGSEVRQALKEIALANKVQMGGVELPTSLKNLSGYDQQQNTFSEEARRDGLEEVKDAIKFTADTMGGGGVDIVSWEFPRTVNDAKWNEKDKNGNRLFDRVSTDEKLASLVDKRNGRIQRVQKNETIYIPYDKEKFTEIEVKHGDPITFEQLKPFEWTDFERWAKTNEEKNKKEGTNLPTSPELIFARVQLEQQKKQTAGAAAREKEFAEAQAERIKEIDNELKNSDLSDERRKTLTDERKDRDAKYEQFRQSYYANMQGVKDTEQRIANFQTIHEYGLTKSTQTYAEAGITAMQQTANPEKPIYVGPEIGWPDTYGSHPKEFVELIEKSRKKMVELLTTKEQIDPETNKPKIDRDGKPVLNPYYDERLDPKTAEQKAAAHIKGLFDTSHMGMWLAHFKPIIDKKTGTQETEEARLERFNGWYVDQVKELAELSKKKGLVGGIQLVDSMSAAHGHLPPGQGIFPVIETAKIFKDAKYKGFMVSEGHEEEKFGAGRIRTKTWQKAGANIGNGYYSTGSSLQWGQVQNAYLGKAYSPLFMFGSYAPSNDFKLWSEVPFE